MRLFNPFEELTAIQREFDRLLGGVGRDDARLRNTFLPARSPRQFPLVNLAEDEDAFQISALAPGLDVEKLQIVVHGNKATISGEKVAPEAGIDQKAFHRSERATGRFSRTITLSADVDQAAVTAEYRDGILEIRLPKREEAKPRKIAVSVA